MQHFVVQGSQTWGQNRAGVGLVRAAQGQEEQLKLEPRAALDLNTVPIPLEKERS